MDEFARRTDKGDLTNSQAHDAKSPPNWGYLESQYKLEHSSAKGQIKQEWIYEVIHFPN